MKDKEKGREKAKDIGGRRRLYIHIIEVSGAGGGEPTNIKEQNTQICSLRKCP